MAWITPKTNWINGDYFNISDYSRIKGNIEYLIDLAKTVYVSWENTKLETVSIETIPHVSFFNNVVKATQELIDHTKIGNTNEMNSYTANERAWNATELNIIENNHLALYTAILNQREILKRISFKLNGGNF